MVSHIGHSMSFFHSSMSLTGYAFRHAVRRRSFIAFSLAAVPMVVAGTIPFSPGIAANSDHFIRAGVSTLLLGGIILCLVIAPRVFRYDAGGSGSKGRGFEVLLSLPVDAGGVTLGIFLGIGAALGVYFLIGGAAYLVTALIVSGGEALPCLLFCTFFSYLLCLTTAAMVGALSVFLSFLPAVVASLLLILAGQAASLWPPLLALFLPPYDILDSTSAAGRVPEEALILLIRAGATLGFYLSFAALIRWYRTT